MSALPDQAIVLAAGLGKRMRPLTETMPKPLVPVAGKPLIDHGLDALVRAGVSRAVVNVHYRAEQLVEHLASRNAPDVAVSDERGRLLDSGGGVAKALTLLNGGPVLIVNSDTLWLDAPGVDTLHDLASRWDPARMDMLIALTSFDSFVGHTGRGDFAFTDGSAIERSREGHVYPGIMILDPAILRGDEPEVHSLNLHFDRAIERGRLHGHLSDALFLTAGTPEAIAEVERAVETRRAAA